MLESLEMSRDEAESLLRAGVVGRIALTAADGPHIVPVNYSVVDDAVIIRTTPYSLLGSAVRGALLAFEIDQIDHEEHHGWSVVARGRAQVVTDADELRHIEETWPPRPWAAGMKPTVVRLPWDEISGRKLGRGWDPAEGLPVRRRLAT